MRAAPYLLVLALLGFVAASSDAQNKAANQEIDAATVAACGKAGLQYGGWVKTKEGLLYFNTGESAARQGRPGFLAPVRFDAPTKLPEIAVPFGLAYPHMDDKTLKALAGVKNLSMLEFGVSSTKLNLKELANFKDLTLLVMRYDQITDDVIGDLCAAKLLHVLSRSSADDGTRPKSEKEIATLDLRGTRVSAEGIIKQLENLANLSTLRTGSYLLTDEVLAALAKPGKLHILAQALAKDGSRPKNAEEVRAFDLRQTRVTGAGLKELAAFKNLTKLDLDLSQVTDAALASLRQIKLRHALGIAETGKQTRPASEDEIEILFLNGTKVSPAGLKELAGLKNVVRVCVDRAKATDEALRGMREAGLLHALYADHPEPPHPKVKAPRSAEEVESFSLYRTAITDAGLKELAVFKNLRILDLSDTRITDAGLKELQCFEHLKELHLPGTQVTDDAVKIVAGLKNLRTVTFFRTKLTKEGLGQLRAALPKCHVYPTDMQLDMMKKAK
jgi:internalin A